MGAPKNLREVRTEGSGESTDVSSKEVFLILGYTLKSQGLKRNYSSLCPYYYLETSSLGDPMCNQGVCVFRELQLKKRGRSVIKVLSLGTGWAWKLT